MRIPIPIPLGLLFLFIYWGFQLLHIFFENYVWKKATPPIYELIFQILCVIVTFILSGFVFVCFFE